MPFQHYTERVKAAVQSGTYTAAHERAKRLEDEGDLAETLESVLAASEGDEAHFDALATRWLVKAVEDKQASLYLVHWAASRLLEHAQLDYRDYTAALRRWAKGLGPPGSAASPRGVEEALRRRDLEAACDRAGELPSLPLNHALRLILLMADRKDRRYEAAARRFIVRVALEIRPEILQIKKLSNCFLYVDHAFYGPFARDALEDVVGQLQRMEALDVSFERKGEP